MLCHVLKTEVICWAFAIYCIIFQKYPKNMKIQQVCAADDKRQHLWSNRVILKTLITAHIFKEV